jgi:hypothetical protein
MLSRIHLPSTGIAIATAFFISVLGVGSLAPIALGPSLGSVAALGLVFLAYRHLATFCVAWLVLAGMSLEMTLHDLIDPSTYTATIATVKVTQLGLGVLCALRYGARLDPFSPAWAYLGIFAIGLVHGLHPGLTGIDSLRSLAGSVAPFAFCFCRPPRGWADAMIRATCWLPLISLAGGLILYAAGLRQVMIDSGGLRLAGLGHPAFLAGVCLAAVYASLIRLYRQGHRSDLVLLGMNLVILVLTGARAPLACAVFVTSATFAFIPSIAMPAHRRWLILLCVAALLPLLGLVEHTLSDIRLFNLLATDDTTHLSGRDLLWPAFEAAAEQSYWVGWGLGSGNVIIPPDSEVAQLLQTWAAHNEYLRMEVEGGQIGRALLIAAFSIWAIRRTRLLPLAERRILRLVFVAFAVHALTDNVLISTPTSVLFSFVAAVFAGGGPHEAATWRSHLPRPAAVA